MSKLFATSLLSLCFLARSSAALAGALDPTEKAIAAYIDENTPRAEAFLERVVNVNSGTMNHPGVRKVGKMFAQQLEAVGFATRWVDLPKDMNRAGHLVATFQGKKAKGTRILLIGHLDTVFEKDSPFQRFERSGNIAKGPGTEDMKGGNTVVIFALRALKAAGVLDQVHATVVFTGDEENPGFPVAVTRKPLIDAAKASDVALNFEAGVDSTSTATIARRGFVGWTLEVTGKQGHSSQVFGKKYGYGAVYEASRILNEFRETLAGERYLTLNPGLVAGGSSVSFTEATSSALVKGKRNIISPQLVVTGDLRALHPDQVKRTKAAMEKIVGKSLPGTSAKLTFSEGYPPMAPTQGNEKLLSLLDGVSRDLGLGKITPVDPGRRGAADISFVAPIVPSLDGIGLVGSGGHSTDEQVDMRSLPIASKKAAVFIYRLSKMKFPSPQGR